MPPIRILLAEDHALVRAGFRALLAGLPGIEVIGEAADGRQALALVAEHRPDVVLMDIAMAGLNGLEATAHIAQKWPEVRVVILSMHANEEYVLEALRAGARGYLLKDAGLSELELAVRAVAAGETYLSPPISRQVIAGYIRRAGAAPATGDAPPPANRASPPGSARSSNCWPKGATSKRSLAAWASAKRRSKPTAPNSWNASTSSTCPAWCATPCARGWCGMMSAEC